MMPKYQEAGSLLETNYLGKNAGKWVIQMQLMPQYVSKKLPKLYSVENEKDPMVKCKFFLPMTKWYWYAMEFDGIDTFFGFVVGDYNELGYFSLSELQSIEGPYGLKVERDMYFDSQPLSKVKRLHE